MLCIACYDMLCTLCCTDAPQVGKETMSLREALKLMKQQAAEMAVKAQTQVTAFFLPVCLCA